MFNPASALFVRTVYWHILFHVCFVTSAIERTRLSNSIRLIQLSKSGSLVSMFDDSVIDCCFWEIFMQYVSYKKWIVYLDVFELYYIIPSTRNDIFALTFYECYAILWLQQYKQRMWFVQNGMVSVILYSLISETEIVSEPYFILNQW